MARNELISVFKQFLDRSSSLLSDFELIFDNKDRNQDLPMLQSAYLDAIIINFSKIFGYLKCDKFGVRNLKCISPKECQIELLKIEADHKDTIEKIITNRNELIAHTDKHFFKLGFSKNYIKKLEEAFKTSFSNMPRAKEKGGERYTPQDMRDDLQEIREIIQKLDKVWTKILTYYYR
jgi:hypothetical protein